MAIEWKDAYDIVSKLGEAFMQGVFKNAPTGTHVCFGQTGTGVAPNYQVRTSDDNISLFSGLSHREWSGDSGEFDADKISAPFYRDELFKAFLSQFRKPRGG